MRRAVLLLVLLVLLPLRGWTGETMAVRLALDAAQAHAGQTPPAALTQDNCHEHRHGPRADAAPAAPALTDDCTTCQACQVCHTLALASFPPELPPLRTGRLPAFGIQFSSAERAPGFKPPIS